jgi:hypothetical protein
MRSIVLPMVIAAAMLSQAGCALPKYSGDPVERVEELLYDSENLRQAKEEWKRIWFGDQPSHMTPERVHGGIV